ncbi:MAG: hypothetical protein ACRER2_14940 [Methylococcales bacterium]
MYEPCGCCHDLAETGNQEVPTPRGDPDGLQAAIVGSGHSSGEAALCWRRRPRGTSRIKVFILESDYGFRLLRATRSENNRSFGGLSPPAARAKHGVLPVVQGHLETWLAGCRIQDEEDCPVTAYMEQDFRKYLDKSATMADLHGRRPPTGWRTRMCAMTLIRPRVGKTLDVIFQSLVQLSNRTGIAIAVFCLIEP